MANISMHDHPMHKGPHHDKYIHEHNRGSGSFGGAKHETSMEKLEGHLKSEDVVGHQGKMSNKGSY